MPDHITAEEVFAQIQTTLGIVCGHEPSEVTPDSTLDDLGIDSIDIVEISMDLEDEFDITIPDDELAEQFTDETTIQKLTAFIFAKTEGYKTKRLR